MILGHRAADGLLGSLLWAALQIGIEVPGHLRTGEKSGVYHVLPGNLCKETRATKKKSPRTHNETLVSGEHK